MRFILANKSSIIIFMVLLLAFKALELNIWKYDRLRTHHSKNYIRSHYVGAGEWLFFTKSIKEVGVLLPVINIVTILLILVYGGLLALSVRHIDIINVRAANAVCSIVFAGCCVITAFATFHNYSALGINVKGNSSSYFERVIAALVFAAIMCFLAFLKARGVLF